MTEGLQKELSAIRDDFFQRYKSDIESGKFHAADLERLQRDNTWLETTYSYQYKNREKTLAKMKDVLLWRKEFGANDLLTPGKLPFPESMLKQGLIFYRNTDVDSYPVLHFRSKHYRKELFDPEHIQKFIAYFLEKAYSFSFEKPIVILFDMTDTGYSNMDMDMTKFLISCFQVYYAGIVRYLLPYQMPFIFNAVWKLVKSWLPAEAVDKIKFVDKKTVKEYIKEDQLFVHMGGSDQYQYNFERDGDNLLNPARLG